MNIKILNILKLTIALLVFSTSCDKDSICAIGNRKVEKKELFLDEIKSIKLKGSGNLYISYGEVQKIEVETNKDLFDRINQDVHNGHWDATFKGCVQKFGRLNFYVTLPKIEKVKLEGSGQIAGNDFFSAENLEIELDGSGKINFKANAQNLKSKVIGSGDIVLEGSSPNHAIDIEGSGAVRSYNLITQATQVDINGSGDALVFVEKELKVKITGSGKVTYKGSPAKETQISGSGSVKQY